MTRKLQARYQCPQDESSGLNDTHHLNMAPLNLCFSLLPKGLGTTTFAMYRTISVRAASRVERHVTSPLCFGFT